VRDVVASGRWYQRLLGCRNEHPDHPEYGKLVSDDGETLLLLHCWDAEPEVAIDRYFVNRDAAPLGHGILLGFMVDDIDATKERAETLACDIIEELHTLPDGWRAFWVRDPDGYTLQFAGPP
jgi:catechol 2,3-dioxygenase-like lactoylglutathione lyase family enzyme